MAYKNEKDCSTLLSEAFIWVKHFTEDSFKQIIVVRSFVGTLLQCKLCQLLLKGAPPFGTRNYLTLRPTPPLSPLQPKH